MMKKALKVTFGAILAVGTVSVAQANANQFFDSIGVQVTGTYTKASNNGQSFGDTFISNALPGGGGRVGAPVFVENDYDLDWGAGANYRFSEHTALYFNYDHFSDGEDNSAVNIRNLALAFPNAPAVGTSTAGVGQVSYNTHEYELGLAHTWAQSPAFCIDYKAQLQWDKFDRTFSEQIDDNAGNFSHRDTSSSFRGFGPGVGLMAHARPLSHCPAFGVFAGGMASALYGKNEFSVIAVDQTGIPIYGIFPENSHSVVAKVDIKFGVDWVNEFAWDGCKVPFGLALGMRYMDAVNVFKNGNMYSAPNAIGPGQAQAFTFNGGASNDFGRFGPYLQFNLGGMA